jgi:uncharacterized protein (DUF433 family)
MKSMPTIGDTTSTEGAIASTPGVCGGRPCIAGTRVSVRGIAIRYNMGASPEEIARQIGHLSLAQVQAALTWYFANKAEIDQDIEDEEREYKILAALHRR